MLVRKSPLPIAAAIAALFTFAGCSGVEPGVVDEQHADAGAVDRGISGDGGASDGASDVDPVPDLDDAGSSDAGSDVDGAPPPPKTKALSIWHWNVAGQKIHGGSTTTGLITAVTSSIRNRKADFVSLNELCSGQYKAIQDGLRALGWPTDPNNFSRFAQSRPAGKSTCAGQAFGNAIFSKEPLGAAGHYTLPSDGSAEDRNMLCAPRIDLPHLRFCTTHITTTSELAADGIAKNTRQLVAVLTRLEAFHAAGDTVVIAGDFNAQPDYARMNRFYSSSLVSPNNAGNTGHYRELDDADPANCLGYGEGTDSSDLKGGPCGTGKKIDLIFVREDKIHGAYAGEALAISKSCGGPCSDHNILIGSVNVLVQGL